MTDPQTLDPRSGRLLPRAVTQIDQRGLSVLRDGATATEFEITFAMMKKVSDAKGEERFWEAVCILPAKSLRYDGSTRSLGVFDTAYADRPHHGDVMAPPLAQRRERERRIKNVADQLSGAMISVDEFRAGAFQRHSRKAATS